MTAFIRYSATMVLLFVVPQRVFAQASSFEVGGPAHQIGHSVDILNCCTHFAITSDSTPQTSITVSGPPWAPPNDNAANDYGSATATSSTQISGSTAGASLTATVSASATPGALPGFALNANAGQGGTYYSFVLTQPSYIDLHASVSTAHSAGGEFAASFSLRAGSAGGGIVNGIALDVNSGSDPGFTHVSVHTPAGTVLSPGTYVLIAAVSGRAAAYLTGNAENFSETLTVNLSLHAAPDEDAIGVVVCSEGTATITRPGGTAQSLTVGTSIHMGDIIETKNQGRACLLFVDDTQFTVSDKTKLAIDIYVFDPTGNESRAQYNVFEGAFRYISGKIGKQPNHDLDLLMPYGSIGIRGTEFIGVLDPAVSYADVYLDEGALDITPWHSGVGLHAEALRFVRFDSGQILESSTLSQETYDALKQQIVPSTDNTPPSTTISFVPTVPNGANSWYTQDVSVALAATDTESGVAATTYEIDGGQTLTYASPFTMSTDGAHTVTFRSRDQAGTLETDHSAGVNIDETKPTKIAFVGSVNNGDMFLVGTVPAAPTCTATDATSGVASCTVTGYGTTAGSYTLVANAIDRAGNADAIRLSYAVSAGTLAHPLGYWRSTPGVMTGLLPEPLGSYVVDTVTKANAVLASPSSKNAYEMLAAQLLVAELNRANGTIAGCVSAVISDAGNLLLAAEYRGPGTTSAPAKTAKTAVTTDTVRLDAFNNAGCP